jgi:hypothetical protein
LALAVTRFWSAKDEVAEKEADSAMGRAHFSAGIGSGTAAFHADLFVNCFHVRKKVKIFSSPFLFFLGLRAAKWVYFWAKHLKKLLIFGKL